VLRLEVQVLKAATPVEIDDAFAAQTYRRPPDSAACLTVTFLISGENARKGLPSHGLPTEG